MSSIRLPLYKQDSTGDTQLLKGYVTTLRANPFTSDTIIGVEAVEAPGFYDYDNVDFLEVYQRWVGTSLTTLTRDKSFSDENGRTVFDLQGISVLDPNDGNIGEIPIIADDGNGGQVFEYVDGSGIGGGSGGLPNTTTLVLRVYYSVGRYYAETVLNTTDLVVTIDGFVMVTDGIVNFAFTTGDLTGLNWDMPTAIYLDDNAGNETYCIADKGSSGALILYFKDFTQTLFVPRPATDVYLTLTIYS